jgi:protease PrsW
MAKWYYLVEGQEVGPIEPAELKRLADCGRLKAHDQLRREDMTNWHQANEVKGLFTNHPRYSGASPSASAAASEGLDQVVAPRTNGSGARGAASRRPRISKDGSTSGSSDDPHSPDFKCDDSSNPPRSSTGTTSRPNPHAADRIHERVSTIWTDLRTLNFWEEIVPIDSSNFGRMLRDPVILAVIGAAISPLVIITLRSDLQLTAFAILFAFVWGMVFKHYIVRASVSWKILFSALFCTGIIGTRAALQLSRLHVDVALSPDVLVSLFGFIFGVGICEESCKILPVIAYLLWKRRNADPKTCILIGVFSGLGFAAFENLHFQGNDIEDAILKTNVLGEYGLREGVRGAMVDAMLRSLSLVFCHALWTGVFAYFLSVAFLTGRRYMALALAGLAVSATMHGVYDWLIVCVKQQTFAAAVMAVTFVLFYAYLIKLQALTEYRPTIEPSSSAT